MSSTLKFRWRQGRLTEYYFAICTAVRAGHRTREALLAVLPQFSKQRLILALESLMTADMVWIELNMMVVSEDLATIEALVEGDALNLPIDATDLKGNLSLLHEVLRRIGIRNPTGTISLLAYDIKGT